MNLNNADFIDGLRQQDPLAAQHLNEYFVPSIWRFVYFRVDRDPHLAEDIVAEAVLALVNAAASETRIEHPIAWLRTVAQRRIQDHFRAAARVQHLIEEAEPSSDIDPGHDPASQHDQKLERQRVRDAMDRLPNNYRLALEWKYVEQLSVRVIAKRLDASEKSAESILFRARNALRKQLKQDESANPRQGSTAASRQTAPAETKPAKANAKLSKSPPEQTPPKQSNAANQNPPTISFAPKLAGEN